jgi:hypothetical protein
MLTKEGQNERDELCQDRVQQLRLDKPCSTPVNRHACNQLQNERLLRASLWSPLTGQNDLSNSPGILAQVQQEAELTKNAGGSPYRRILSAKVLMAQMCNQPLKTCRNTQRRRRHHKLCARVMKGVPAFPSISHRSIKHFFKRPIVLFW